MGEARRRGSFEERKAEAIKAGRDPEVRRQEQRDKRIARANFKAEYIAFIRKLLEEQQQLAKQ